MPASPPLHILSIDQIFPVITPVQSSMQMSGMANFTMDAATPGSGGGNGGGMGSFTMAHAQVAPVVPDHSQYNMNVLDSMDSTNPMDSTAMLIDEEEELEEEKQDGSSEEEEDEDEFWSGVLKNASNNHCCFCAKHPRVPVHGCYGIKGILYDRLTTVEIIDIDVAAYRLGLDGAYVALTQQWLAKTNRTGNIPQCPQDCTPRQKRLILYYKIFLYIWQDVVRPDTSVREQITLCLRDALNTLYPDDERDACVFLYDGSGATFFEEVVNTIHDRAPPSDEVIAALLEEQEEDTSGDGYGVYNEY